MSFAAFSGDSLVWEVQLYDNNLFYISISLQGLVIVLCIIVSARMIYKRKDDEQAVPLLDSSDIS